ncbi:membrane protein insertion efficiency factor YidD [Kitasatospora sp. NPDC051853]|uniref:membrane protein insertion efficiency factor YidD n=1 Tax=Kitasatospora sp. NPDC051853 TaxID=3364058 RepID=UPI0037A89ECA
MYPPPPRPPYFERAWWWLPEEERRRRREQRRAWERYKAQRKDNDPSDIADCCTGNGGGSGGFCGGGGGGGRGGGGGGGGGGCGGDGCDVCLIAMIPVVFTSGLRAVLNAHRAPRLPGGRASAFLHGSVEHYRTRISPTRPACCPYTPSCSTYAVQALQRHGALRAVRLTAGRLRRCRPGTRGGSDPVPE